MRRHFIPYHAGKFRNVANIPLWSLNGAAAVNPARPSTAFQDEEIRVASVKLQRINVSNSAEMKNYYTQALLSLGLLLLPRISLVTLGIEPSASCTIHQLATISANVFYDRHPIQTLFKRVPEVMRSKPDRIVVTEMFHVKAWQEISLDESSQELYINVFHVAVAPMAKKMV